MKYADQASSEPTASRSPSCWSWSGTPPPRAITTTPAIATTVQSTSGRASRSPSRTRAATITSAGCSDPITVGTATPVSFTALKNRDMSRLSSSPPSRDSRRVRAVRNRPRTSSPAVSRTAPSQVRQKVTTSPDAVASEAMTPAEPQPTAASDAAATPTAGAASPACPSAASGTSATYRRATDTWFELRTAPASAIRWGSSPTATGRASR